MGKKVAIAVLIIIIVFVAYQLIKVHSENATLDRNLFAVLKMYKKRMEQGAGMKPKIEDMRRDAHLEFKNLGIPINPKDIEVEVNFEEDYLGFKAKYWKEVPFIIFTQRKLMNVDVRLDLAF